MPQGQVTASVGETPTEQDYANFPDTLFATGAPTTRWMVPLPRKTDTGALRIFRRGVALATHLMPQVRAQKHRAHGVAELFWCVRDVPV